MCRSVLEAEYYLQIMVSRSKEAYIQTHYYTLDSEKSK